MAQAIHDAFLNKESKTKIGLRNPVQKEEDDKSLVSQSILEGTRQVLRGKE